MTVDGTWRITIDADEIDPMIVPQTATLTLRKDGAGFGGTISGPYPLGDDVEVLDVNVGGEAVDWSAHMRGDGRRGQVLEFHGKLGDDEIIGEVEIGIFGTGTFRATRS